MSVTSKAQPNKGLYNSSLTRVYPLFGRLIDQDPSGRSWLPNLLQNALDLPGQKAVFPVQTGPLLPWVVAKRTISGNVLKYHGLNCIELPSCFEKSIPPSDRFVRWLIEHPERLTWPDNGKTHFSLNAQAKREDLLGWLGTERQASAQQEALTELAKKGASRSHRKWWAFEGTTSVDCFLETENLILLIEGKRTEPLSGSVSWYPGRNQLVRNLEVAQELAGKKHFAVLVIADKCISPLPSKVVADSLPHFSDEERQGLMRHYLGCLTWRQACEAVNIPYKDLPETVPEWIASVDNHLG